MGTVINTSTPQSLWTSQYLSDLAQEAEIQISTEVNAIYCRFPLNVVLGQSVYDFQTDTTPAQRLTGIIRITYQGWTVLPTFQDQLRNNVVPLKPWDGDVISSRPFLYMRLGYGIDGIKFFPAPNLSIPYDNTDITTQTGITNNVIVSGWRIADPTGTTYRLPDYIRETLVRYYVMARAYKKEGKGQNLDASKYFEGKYQKLLARFKTIVSQLFSCRMHGVRDPLMNTYGRKPPRPSLPTNFGTVVPPYGTY
jgi:hypothetical protein